MHIRIGRVEGGGHEPPLIVQGGIGGETITGANLKVLRSVARSCVDTSCPLVQRDMLPQHQQGIGSILLGVRSEGPTQLHYFPPRKRAKARSHPQPTGPRHFLDTLPGHDQHLGAQIHQIVGIVGMERDGEVGRKRPGGGGPNQD